MGSRGRRGGGERETETEEDETWKLRVGDDFTVPERFHRKPPFFSRIFPAGSHGHLLTPPILNPLSPFLFNTRWFFFS
jgi:hypothetical protein